MSSSNDADTLAPIGSTERIGELDILRGFALLGVFIVHFVGAGFYNLPLDPGQAELFEQAGANRMALFVSDMFFYNKANTLFATLFGMGFWVMLERLEARGAAFSRIYLRRLFALFLLGAVNVFLIFPGDVLHEYALLGFVLFLLRKLPASLMLGLGLILAIAGFYIEYIESLLSIDAAAAWDRFNVIQAAAFADGGYLNWVWETGQAHVQRDIIETAFLGWALYIFSRFLLGAWIIREGLIQRSEQLQSQMRLLLLIILPLGLALEGSSMAILLGAIDGPEWLEELLHLLAAPTLAAGYALALIVLFHSRWAKLVRVFAPVGRMALTAYVAHGAIFTLVYFPFGLDLLGYVSPTMAMGIALMVYMGLTLFCHLWLRHYRFGPLEFLWRWATYGKRPSFLLNQGRF